LIVESDLDTVEQLSSTLRNAGFAVETAYNCGDAMAQDPRRYLLALVNATMRDRNGRGILELVHDHPLFSRLATLTINDLPGQVGPNRKRFLDNNAILARIDQAISSRNAIRDAESTQRIDTQTVRSILKRATTPPTGNIDQQMARLKTLSALARSISSVLDVTQVLNQVVEAATTLTNAEEGMLLLPDEEDKALYLRAMKGVDDNSARNFRVRSDEPLMMRVYRSGEPVTLGDQGLMKLKTEYFVKSLLYVPMQVKGRTLGVLGVNNRNKTEQFTDLDLELLLDLAAHAGNAIENARIYEERLLQNRQLTTLVETGLAVNSTLALPDVLLTICKQVIRALSASGCLIQQRVDGPNGEVLQSLARAWQAAWRMERGPVLALDERPLFKQALTQNAYYTVGRSQAPSSKTRYEAEQLEMTGANDIFVLPIRAGNQASFGALELFYRATMPEITSELRMRLRALALEITTALPQKYEQRPSASIFSTMQRLLDAANADWCALWLKQGEDKIEKVAEHGMALFVNEPAPQSEPISADLEAAFENHQPLNFHAREADIPPSAREILFRHGGESVLRLPMLIKGRNFGVFTLYSTLESRRFRSDEISFAQALVAQAATAIENAGLYRDLQGSLYELKLAQASLVQAARLSTMGELAAVVAHQINNPLTTVMVDSEILLQDLPESSPMREGVIAINRAGKRAHAVVKRLLSTARRNKPDDERQWIDVHQTIRNTFDLVLSHLERGGVKFTAELDDQQPMFILAFPGHLEDVWLNMLLNGRDALQDVANPRLGIATRFVEPDQMEAVIWDNGKGISPENLSSIFEPFFTTKPPGEGTGLGLHICRQVVEQCGGKISVESAVGEGTRFHISLPVQNDPV